MHLADQFRATGFRLALAFTVFFAVGTVITATIAFLLTARELDRQLDASIEAVQRTFVSAYKDGGLVALLSSVELQVRSIGGEDEVYLLTAPDGHRLSGNISFASLPMGWTSAAARRPGFDQVKTLRMLGFKIDRYVLVIGRSTDPVLAASGIITRAFAIGSMVWVACAALGGLLLGLNAQRRIKHISGVLEGVAEGDLDRRIAVKANRNTDIDRIAHAINGALDRLRSLVKALQQVSTDIAHDLKSPIARLRLTLEDAKLKAARSEPVEESLERALHEARSVAATFDSLLQIAQIESGARRVQFMTVDLGEIVAGIAEDYTAVAEDAGQRLDIEPAPQGVLQLRGDRQLLTRMLVNLVENAIRHCPAGARIAVATAREGDRILLTVADNGPGIPPSERDKVFERFYRLDRSRTTPGNGLGLCHVAAIVELHAGKIAMGDNAPGLGVRMHFPASRA